MARSKQEVEANEPLYTQAELDAAVAGAYLDATKHWPVFAGTSYKCACGHDHTSGQTWEEHIRSLTPADAKAAMERRDADLQRYKRALEIHLCEPDMADWLMCAGHDGTFCEVCEAADKRHYHQLFQECAEKDATIERLEAEVSILRTTCDAHIFVIEEHDAVVASLQAELAALQPKIKRAASMLAMLAERDPKGRETIDDFADELYETSCAIDATKGGSHD